MQKEKVKLGLLGCGGIAGAHANGFRSGIELGEVVAVAEPDEKRHSLIRQWFGDEVTIVDDYRKVLAMSEIAGVDIVLPHDLHMEAAVAAAEAGKHVLVEKVMARNVWECDRMIEACEKAGVTLTICHDRRYHGEWEALKDIVESGVLGKIFFWKLDHNQDVQMPPGHWIRSRDGIGGGAIMSCLTHQIDGLRWYGGEVAKVTCMTRTIPARMEGEFLGVIAAEMADGALAELSINWWTRSNAGDNCLWYEMVQVCGEKGEAYRMSGRGTFVRLHDPNSPAVKRYGEDVLKGFVQIPVPGHMGHQKCIIEWLKMLRGEPAEIRTSGRDCRGTVEVAEAAYLSMREERTVALPVTPVQWVNSSGRASVNPGQAGSAAIQSATNPDNPLSKGA